MSRGAIKACLTISSIIIGMFVNRIYFLELFKWYHILCHVSDLQKELKIIF